MLKHLLVLTCALLASSSALAQVMARDLGDFELKLATSPTRSMARAEELASRAQVSTSRCLSMVLPW